MLFLSAASSVARVHHGRAANANPHGSPGVFCMSSECRAQEENKTLEKN